MGLVSIDIKSPIMEAYSVILKLQTLRKLVSSSVQCWCPLRREIAVRRTEAGAHLNMTRNCEEIVVMNLK